MATTNKMYKIKEKYLCELAVKREFEWKLKPSWAEAEVKVDTKKKNKTKIGASSTNEAWYLHVGVKGNATPRHATTINCPTLLDFSWLEEKQRMAKNNDRFENMPHHDWKPWQLALILSGFCSQTHRNRYETCDSWCWCSNFLIDLFEIPVKGTGVKAGKGPKGL